MTAAMFNMFNMFNPSVVLGPSFDNDLRSPVQKAHPSHHLEAARWECSLEAVCKDLEGRDCAHR
eukprot:5148626-Amphidinium_carterae.1